MPVPSAARGVLAWTLAVLGAMLALLALAVRARMETAEGGILRTTYEVRFLLAAAAVLVAFGARRTLSHPEAVGLLALAAAFVLTAVADAATVAWAPQAARDGRIAAHLAWGRVASASLGVALPGLLAARAMGVRAADLVGFPRAAERGTLVALAAGILLFPTLSALKAYGDYGVEALVREAKGAADSLAAPTFAAALRHVAIPTPPTGQLPHTLITLVLTLPSLELLLHGALRQSFGRWGLLPFVAGTALCAAVLTIDRQASFGVFGGALATGLLAARSGSVLPGIVFWQASYLGYVAWGLAIGSSV